MHLEETEVSEEIPSRNDLREDFTKRFAEITIPEHECVGIERILMKVFSCSLKTITKTLTVKTDQKNLWYNYSRYL